MWATTFLPRRGRPRGTSQPGPSFRWTNGGGTTQPPQHPPGRQAVLLRAYDRRARSTSRSTPPPAPTTTTARSTALLSSACAGVVKVRPIALPDSLSGEIEVRWANSGTDTGSRFDVRYRVDQRKWKIWKNDTRQVPAPVRPQRQPGQLQAQPPQLQDQGALGAQEGREAQRLVPGAQARIAAEWTTGCRIPAESVHRRTSSHSSWVRSAGPDRSRRSYPVSSCAATRHPRCARRCRCCARRSRSALLRAVAAARLGGRRARTRSGR